MNCPKCGNEIQENQKFCTNCGANLENINAKSQKYIIKYLILIACLLIFAGIITFCIINNIQAKSSNKLETLPSRQQNLAQKTKAKSDYELKTPMQVLNKIDELQARYFTIIKRNDVLLGLQDNKETLQDSEDLENLFIEVESNIDKNNYYLQKHHEIEKTYENNPGENTLEMNAFAHKNYDAVDNLLNEVYQEVRKTIPKEDFNALITSEMEWLKEVENYNSVFEQQGFGSMGRLVKLGYEVNMRSFRTLLLMLYL